MDPEPLPCSTPTILHNSSKLQVVEPYHIHSSNIKAITDYGQIINKIEAIFKDNHSIKQFGWKWFNNVKAPQINKLIQILPSSLTKLSLSGSLYLSSTQLANMLNKFVGLEFVDIYCELDGPLGSYGWDMNYQVNIRNSMKNFKQSQKWCHLISQNPVSISKQILPVLPSQIKTLSLRNIALGKSPKSVKTILQCCPHLKQLDLGMTQLTDMSFEGIVQSAVSNFASQVASFDYADCNRITHLALQAIFPGILAGTASKQDSCYSSLKLLDVSRTNVANSFRIVNNKLPNLLSLSLSSLEIQQSVILASQAHQHNKLEQIVIEYAVLSPLSMSILASISSCLHSLTLSYIQTPATPKAQTNISELAISLQLRRLNLNYNTLLTGGWLKRLLQNALNLEVLKISGTNATATDVQHIGKSCPKLKWLEISYLKQVDKKDNEQCNPTANVQGQQKTKVSTTPMQSFSLLIESLEKLQYCQAYEFLSKDELSQFKKRQIPAKVVFVLDSEGPFTLPCRKAQ